MKNCAECWVGERGRCKIICKKCIDDESRIKSKNKKQAHLHVFMDTEKGSTYL